MNKIILLLLAFLSLAVLPCLAADSEDITVEVEGYGVSQPDALLKAKREAVSKGIGTVLISETEVKNFMLQKDVVLTQTVGAVKSYQIIKQEKQAGDTYMVRIKATVSMASIKADLVALKILLESMDKPRMLVVVQEEGGNAAENAILDYLSEKKFELVDAATVAALMQSDDDLIRKATEGDPVAAAKIGAENGAEYVIVAKVTAGISANEMLAASGLKSGQATITAKVVNCSNARIIASKSAHSAAAHISEDIAKAQAIEKAAKKLMDRKLFEQIVGSFQDIVNNGVTLDVTVKNVDSFRLQKDIRQVIGGLDVVSLNKRSFGGGQLKLSVVFKGNADLFSEAVDGKKVNGKKLAVTDINGNRVVIVVR